jgi:hypothetical protein
MWLLHCKSNGAGPGLKCHLTHEVWNTLHTLLALLHLKHIYPFMSQMTLIRKWHKM